MAVAAAPGPVPTRIPKADGTMETVLEPERPDLEDLKSRVATVLNREGDALRAGTLLLPARFREHAERERIARERRTQSLAVIERHQWLAAAAAFANPVLVLGPMAAGAIQLKMLGEMAAIYNASLSSQLVETLGGQMAQTFFKLGITEAAASVLGGTPQIQSARVRGWRSHPGGDHGLPDSPGPRGPFSNTWRTGRAGAMAE